MGICVPTDKLLDANRLINSYLTIFMSYFYGCNILQLLYLSRVYVTSAFVCVCLSITVVGCSVRCASRDVVLASL